jgi:hypothetical protein
MQEIPHELPRDMFEAELEMRVLVHSVVAGIESKLGDAAALLFADFINFHDPGRIAGARSGHTGVQGPLEIVSQRDQRLFGNNVHKGSMRRRGILMDEKNVGNWNPGDPYRYTLAQADWGQIQRRGQPDPAAGLRVPTRETSLQYRAGSAFLRTGSWNKLDMRVPPLISNRFLLP